MNQYIIWNERQCNKSFLWVNEIFPNRGAEEHVEKWGGSPWPGRPCPWEIQDKKGAF